jgi:uncharacterized damage-inducible protein DinB
MVATSDTGQAFLNESRKYLTLSYLPRIERCLASLSDEDIWWRANPESNSVGNLVLHLAGNVRQWIVSGVGGAADIRRRQAEFEAQGPIPREQLLAALASAVNDADAVLGRTAPASLPERRVIQGHDVTLLQAIYYVVEHFSMHTGQIIYAAKMRGGDLAFYDVTTGVPVEQWHK